jgi:rubredoxin
MPRRLDLLSATPLENICPAKHTKVQVPDSDWKCPKCGEKANGKDGFVIGDGPAMDCELLHADDSVECYKCGYGGSGAAFSRLYAKAQNLVPCEHCKGTGTVKKSSPGVSAVGGFRF